MNKTQLRPYQINMVKQIMLELENKQSVMCQMPTGTGKTEVFCEIIKQYLNQNENKRILILVHRVELLRQIRSRLRTNLRIHVGTIDSDGLSDFQHNVIIGMVASVVKKNLDFSNWLLIIDEAHHSNANTYVTIIERAFERGRTKLLGVTATPARLDGKKLSDIYESLLVTPSLKKFIEHGYLSKIRYYGIRNLDIGEIQISKLTGDYDLNSASKLMRTDRILAETLSSYQSFAEGKKTLIFCVDIAHANDVKDKFSDNDIDCDIINSKTNEYTRNNIVEKFKNTKNAVLINVLIFTEGFDCPDIDVVMLARPTQSITLYLQMVGRATRMSEGKEFGIILDNAANYMIHGLPTTNFDWKAMFFNTKGLTNQEYSSQNRKGSKLMVKNPPLESNNLEMYELIDEDSFSCYGSDSNLDDYINFSFSNDFSFSNEKFATYETKYLPNNREVYYFKNDKCPKCKKLVHEFKNTNKRISVFDSTIPLFKLHTCIEHEDINTTHDSKYIAFPVQIMQNSRFSSYQYIISKLGFDKICLKQMIYEEIDEDTLEGLNPITARRISDSELCLSIFDMAKRKVNEIILQVTNNNLDTFFSKELVINEIKENENLFEYGDKDFFIDTKTTTPNEEIEDDFDDDEYIPVMGNYLDDGNAVDIGGQIWMTKNLNVNKFRNGDIIYEARTNEEWDDAGRRKIPACCFYENNEIKYGMLYNWYAVNDKRLLAPDGWELPTILDWDELIEILGGEDMANHRLKMFEEWNCTKDSSNTKYSPSGFSALPGGCRLNDGKFLQKGLQGNWWSTSTLVYNKQLAKFKSVFLGDNINFQNKIQQGFKANGYSVRCIKKEDSYTNWELYDEDLF